ncbi:MAG TPA: hypothetical protein DHU89_08380 [Flavobacteriales bacterium]|nr:hypothetical protein [Flavobacteriales bacterium]
MKTLVKIIFILMLISAVSSCTKTETEGFEDVVITTKSKLTSSNEITEEQETRPNPNYRSSDDDNENSDGDQVTDDDDDDDDDEGKSDVDK